MLWNGCDKQHRIVKIALSYLVAKIQLEPRAWCGIAANAHATSVQFEINWGSEWPYACFLSLQCNLI